MRRFAYISLIAAISTVGLKFYAYYLTSSVGILSDAIESLVNLVSSIVLISCVILSLKPPDKNHLYGHGKIEYFSSALEGLLIIIAGSGIIYTSIKRLLQPCILSSIELGILISSIAGVINLIAGFIILKGAKRFNSIALEADAKHLFTDVLTTLGVVVGLGIMYFVPDKFWFVDPAIGLVLGIHILFMGMPLLKRSFSELLDKALSEEEMNIIKNSIFSHKKDNKWHGLKARRAGQKRFVEFHLLFPGKMSVKKSHDICCEIEKDIKDKLPNTQVTIHVEPEEDEKSWDSEHVGGLEGEGK